MIYGLRFKNGGLGDYWQSISYFLTESEKKQQTIQINVNQKTKDTFAWIRPLLDSTGSYDFVNEKADYLPSWEELCYPVVKTKTQWQDVKSNTICYQFDGYCDANLKNPFPHEIQQFFERMKQFNFQNVGNYLNVYKGIKFLSTAKIFVGCPSGLSIIALSVGVPIYVVYNRLPNIERLIDVRYKDKNIKFYKNLSEISLQPI